MKFIHTSDVHLDMCFAGASFGPGFGNRRRQALRDTFARIVRRAGDWPADALLIAGDLFEADRVSRDTVQYLQHQFKSIPHVRVFIAPGNHDPYTAHSPYATEAWPENVVIFRKPEWTSRRLLDGKAIVHGFAFDGPQISRNPFGTLEIDRGRRGIAHVALGHGSERHHQPPDKAEYAPFDAADATPKGLHYLALGHFHGVTEVEGDFETRVFYSGAPEGHSFREQGMRHFLEVEIESSAVKVTPVSSSSAVYVQESVACDSMESTHEIVETLRQRAAAVPAAAIARIRLEGALDAAIRDEISGIADAVQDAFEALDLVDETQPLEDLDDLAREDSSLGEFVRSLRTEHAAADADRAALLDRALEAGIAAFRGRRVPVRGLPRG